MESLSSPLPPNHGNHLQYGNDLFASTLILPSPCPFSGFLSPREKSPNYGLKGPSQLPFPAKSYYGGQNAKMVHGLHLLLPPPVNPSP